MEYKIKEFKMGGIDNESLKNLLEFSIHSNIDIINIKCDSNIKAKDVEKKLISMTNILSTLTCIFCDDLSEYKKYLKHTIDEQFWITIEEDRDNISVEDNIDDLIKIIDFLNSLEQNEDDEKTVNLKEGVYEYFLKKVIERIGLDEYLHTKNKYKVNKEIKILINGD